MLSCAQEARVREILEGHAPGTFPAYCLEHLAATAQIPTAHLADLAAFVRNLRACGACQTQFGGVCGSCDHATPRLLISPLRIPQPQEARRGSSWPGPMRRLLRWLRRWFGLGGRDVPE